MSDQERAPLLSTEPGMTAWWGTYFLPESGNNSTPILVKYYSTPWSHMNYRACVRQFYGANITVSRISHAKFMGLRPV